MAIVLYNQFNRGPEQTTASRARRIDQTSVRRSRHWQNFCVRVVDDYFQYYSPSVPLLTIKNKYGTQSTFSYTLS